MSTLSWNLMSCMLPTDVNANLRAAGYHVPSGDELGQAYKRTGIFQSVGAPMGVL